MNTLSGAKNAFLTPKGATSTPFIFIWEYPARPLCRARRDYIFASIAEDG